MDKKELREIICDVLKIDKLNPTIEGQIHRFIMELGLEYKEIAQALVFYIEVEKGEYDPKYGIGIVPYVVERAKEYFKQKKSEKERQLRSVEEAKQTPDIVLKVGQIKKRRKLGTININEIDVD
jgi:hypothetical protein